MNAQAGATTSSEPFAFSAEFLHQLERLELLVRRMLRGQIRGEQRTNRLGRSLELFDYRAYQHGDDLRYVDWNLYSRLDQLFVKLFAAEEDRTLHLLIDASASMGVGQPSKFDHVRHVGAALGYVGLAHFERVGIATFADGLQARMPPRRGRQHVSALLDFIANSELGGTTNMASSLAEFSRGERHPGQVIVLSDCLAGGDLGKSLRALKAHRHDVTLVHILAEEDIAPPLAGDLQLTDIETRGPLRLSMDENLRDAFTRRFDTYLRSLEQLCASSGIGYARATTAISFEDIVLRYLRAGSLLR